MSLRSCYPYFGYHLPLDSLADRSATGKSDVNVQCTLFYNTLHTAINMHFPIRVAKVHSCDKPRITPEIKLLSVAYCVNKARIDYSKQIQRLTIIIHQLGIVKYVCLLVIAEEITYPLIFKLLIKTTVNRLLMQLMNTLYQLQAS